MTKFNRAPDVEVFGLIEAPIDKVWALFKPFGKENLDWWYIYETMTIVSPGKDEVGCVRQFKLSEGGLTFDEKLVARDDTKYFEQYDFVSVSPEIPGLQAISTFVEFHPVTETVSGKVKATKVRWYSYTETDSPQLKQGLMQKQKNAYLGGIQFLKNKLASLAEASKIISISEEEMNQCDAHVNELLGKLKIVMKQVLNDIQAEQTELWEYQPYDNIPALPNADLSKLPKAVKGLPRSQALDPTRQGRFFKRFNDILYTQVDTQKRLQETGDIYQAVQGGYIGKNQHIIDHWKDDREYASHFFNGLNPMVISIVDDIERVPDNMRGLMYQNQTLTDLIAKKSLLLLNYSELEEVKPYRGMYVYPVTALIVQCKDGDQYYKDMVGIRLNDKFPVFTPQSPKNRWMLAKLHLKCADNQVMQFVWHLGFGHLAVEPFAVAFHNSFPDSIDHPIKDLLMPHFKDTIGINYVARHTLVSNVMPFTDDTFSTGTAQGLSIMLNAWLKWDFNDSSFPNQLAKRGFDRGDDGIKNYYFRDDGFKLWDIFGEYTTDFVNAAYTSDNDVAEDTTIKAWISEMRSPDKANISSFPEVINTKQMLVSVLQNIIWKTSAGHAIHNFAQFDYGGYVPNYPISMMAAMPEGEDEIPDDYVKTALPHTIQKILFQVAAGYLLTEPSQYRFSGPLAIQPLKDLYPEVQKRANLRFEAFSNEVKVRNMKLADEGILPYTYLDPENLPPSIDI
ncbi:MAG: lipoxygenase family protein [Gammaproteobacteria bacterium]|nr:lipoxygenase family protein [Gammaproteobacteria bacterium]